MCFNGYAIKGCGCRSDPTSPQELNKDVVEKVAVKWKDLGLELLNSESAQAILVNIEADYKGDVSSHIL